VDGYYAKIGYEEETDELRRELICYWTFFLKSAMKKKSSPAETFLANSIFGLRP
jgi:hypothetical protein